jgi:hypothetical protein
VKSLFESKNLMLAFNPYALAQISLKQESMHRQLYVGGLIPLENFIFMRRHEFNRAGKSRQVRAALPTVACAMRRGKARIRPGAAPNGFGRCNVITRDSLLS